jgi:DNA-binding NarL/FixJ family response regulator
MNIVLVDDHKMVRDGLRAVLEREGDLHIAGEADDGRTAVALCWSVRPDLVVMDIGLPKLDGTEATRQLVARDPRLKVVALSMSQDPHSVRSMFEAGASGFCVKSAAGEELVRAIRAVSQDERYLSPSIADALSEVGEDGSAASSRPLTPREVEMKQWDYRQITDVAEAEIRQLLQEADRNPSDARLLRHWAYGAYLGWRSITTGRQEAADDARLKALVELGHP